MTRPAVPRILADTAGLAAATGEPGVSGAVWKLQEPSRDLDANVIALAPGGTIDLHDGPDVDVLIHVLAGSGVLTTAGDQLDLAPGALVWLPRRSRRGVAAGQEGLRYLTVHQRRQALVITGPATSRPRAHSA
ncbi:MAG: hypothetical protein IRZ08_03635 [Frankia sp.]|nr:hypothetical protein [Frankia sp.]